MRKIKVWGGEHPDEQAALACADSLEAHPLPNVSSGIANPLARRLGKRLVDSNLVLAFPGDSTSPNYEERRAVEVLQESQGYYAVCSLHNFGQFGENMGIINAEQGVSQLVLGFLSELGIREIVLTNRAGIQKYVPNTFVLEMDPKGLGRDIEKLRDAFDALANCADHPRADVADFDWFIHLPSAHVTQFDPARFTKQERTQLHEFSSLPEDIAACLGHNDIPVYMMTWRYAPNEQGYWGEPITPTTIPDDSLWPSE